MNGGIITADAKGIGQGVTLNLAGFALGDGVNEDEASRYL